MPDAQRGLACLVDTAVNANGSITGDLLASLTTPLWNIPSKARTGRALMADSALRRPSDHL